MEKQTETGKLVQEIKQLREVVARDPFSFPNKATIPAFQMQQRQARDQLPALERRYGDLLAARSVVVAPVRGEHDRAFGDLARTEDALVVDVEDLYREIASAIEPGVGAGRDWTAHQHVRALELCMDHARNLGVGQLIADNRVPFTKRLVKDFEATVEATHDTVRQMLGDDVARAYARKRLTDEALKEELEPKQAVGVVLLGARSEEEARELAKAWPTTSSTVVTLTTPPTVKDVLAIFRGAAGPKAGARSKKEKEAVESTETT